MYSVKTFLSVSKQFWRYSNNYKWTLTFRPASSSSASSSSNTSNKLRLSKLIATYTQHSRREASKLIANGQVTIAGTVTKEPFREYDPKTLGNSLKVMGKLIIFPAQSDQPRVWLAHKVKGELVTHAEEQDVKKRPSFLMRLKKTGIFSSLNTQIKTIGRLDLNSEGLMLVTNNGMYKRQLELPLNQIHRRYRVRVHGNITEQKLRSMRSGVTYKNIKYKGLKVDLEKSKDSTNTWLTMTCIEGKNRLIRNICECLGLQVTRLIRVGYGDYELKDIPINGGVLEVPIQFVKDHKRRGLLTGTNQFATEKFKKKKKYEKNKHEDSCNKAKPVQWVKY